MPCFAVLEPSHNRSRPRPQRKRGHRASPRHRQGQNDRRDVSSPRLELPASSCAACLASLIANREE